VLSCYVSSRQSIIAGKLKKRKRKIRKRIIKREGEREIGKEVTVTEKETNESKPKHYNLSVGSITLTTVVILDRYLKTKVTFLFSKKNMNRYKKVLLDAIYIFF